MAGHHREPGRVIPRHLTRLRKAGKMAEITKRISSDDRLKYIAMMTMAVELVRETNKLRETIGRILGIDTEGHISDVIWGENSPNPSIADLDRVLLLEGIGVEDD